MEKIKKFFGNKYFVAFALILILGFIIIMVVNKNNKPNYILVSNTNILKCKKNNCEMVNKEKLVDKELEMFDVYNPTYLGEYNGKYNTKWNFFDLQGNWVDIIDGFVAGSKTLNLKMPDYTTRDLNIEELQVLDNILKQEKNITNYTDLEQLVVEYDFNKNEKQEKLIIVSNATLDSPDEILFSAVIAFINNKYEVLEFESVKNSEFYLLPAYRLKGIINIFNNKKDYILLIKGYYSEEKESTSILYEVSNRHFKNILN